MNERDTCPHNHKGFSIGSGAYCKDCGAFLNADGQTWTMANDFCNEECMGRCPGECEWPSTKPRRYSNGPKQYRSFEEFMKQ